MAATTMYRPGKWVLALGFCVLIADAGIAAAACSVRTYGSTSFINCNGVNTGHALHGDGTTYVQGRDGSSATAKTYGDVTFFEARPAPKPGQPAVAQRRTFTAGDGLQVTPSP